MKKARGIAKNRGLSMLEMLIVAAIIALVTTISLSGYKDFSQRIVVTTLAQDVASNIRQAQSYGLNVKGLGSAGNRFDVAYGVRFDAATSFRIFRDDDKSDPRFGASGVSSVTLDTLTISDSFEISDLCGDNTCGLSWLDITFVRPDPDATIRGPAGTYSTARVTVRDTRSGDSKSIEILSTGYIGLE